MAAQRPPSLMITAGDFNRDNVHIPAGAEECESEGRRGDKIIAVASPPLHLTDDRDCVTIQERTHSGSRLYHQHELLRQYEARERGRAYDEDIHVNCSDHAPLYFMFGIRSTGAAAHRIGVLSWNVMTQGAARQGWRGAWPIRLVEMQADDVMRLLMPLMAYNPNRPLSVVCLQEAGGGPADMFWKGCYSPRAMTAWCSANHSVQLRFYLGAKVFRGDADVPSLAELAQDPNVWLLCKTAVGKSTFVRAKDMDSTVTVDQRMVNSRSRHISRFLTREAISVEMPMVVAGMGVSVRITNVHDTAALRSPASGFTRRSVVASFNPDGAAGRRTRKSKKKKKRATKKRRRGKSRVACTRKK